MFLPPSSPTFTFIDLFAGIGGFRLAFQNLGGECVFSSEIDRFSQQTYQANFGDLPHGDIRAIDADTIPNHDILLAGFPCQAFSIAGRREGFNDTRGTLFFEIARVLEAKRPRAFCLENVKGLTHHKRGKTLQTILRVLRDDLGYYVPEPQLLNARDFGVPQNRDRIFIVGFAEEVPFAYPQPLDKPTRFGDVKSEQSVSVQFYLSQRYLDTLRKHRARHEAKGHGFGYRVVQDDEIASALVVGGMGRERNLVIDHRLTDFTPVTRIVGEVNREGIRRMTPREWARLQGFPDQFRIVVSNTQAYKQFANAVAVPVVEAIGRAMLNVYSDKNRLW